MARARYAYYPFAKASSQKKIKTPAPHGASHNPSGKKRRSALVPALLIFLFWVGILVLGVLIIAGCMAKSSVLSKLYLAELSADGASDVSLRVGYFGGCVSVGDTVNGADNIAERSNSLTDDDSNSHSSAMHCITNLHTKNSDDIIEEFSEKLSSSNVEAPLNEILPFARKLQSNVFVWQLPVISFVFFIISSIGLIVGCAGSGHSRLYKALMFIATVLGALTVALALVTSIGSLLYLNALVSGGKSTSSGTVDGGIVITRGKIMDHVQAGHSGLITVFFFVMGILFVRR